jgi:hypothetical protein
MREDGVLGGCEFAGHDVSISVGGVVAAGMASSFESVDEGLADSPNAHVVEVESVAVAGLQRLDKEMLGSDALQELVTGLGVHHVLPSNL